MTRNTLSLCAMLFALAACEKQPTQPVYQDAPVAAFGRSGQPAVELCHRTNGNQGYIRITVADPAVRAHLKHGDGLVGDPVPGHAETHFDETCRPVESRRSLGVTGNWGGTSFSFAGLFTVASPGPVDAVANVSATDGTWPLHLALLGYNPLAPNPPGSCSTLWLPAVLPAGPTMHPPTITAHWDAVPPGTYCLNVVSSNPVPPYPPPYGWTATITYP